MNKRLSVLWTVFLTSLMLMMAFSILISNDDDTTVSAKESSTADAMGYTWIDNKDPAPKAEYNWMDISSVGTSLKSQFPQSYQGIPYLYPIPTYQPLGFDFPFYGKTYGSIQIYPNGVLGFGPTDYGYAIYNYQGPLPNTYTYTPKGVIAPYWVYYGGVKDLFTYQGTTTEGMKYWVCTWDRLDYYYYLYQDLSPGAVVQCILYENGDIQVNVKTGYLYYGYYLTVGICNEERDVGTTYHWSSSNSGGLNDGTAVFFKQFKTEIMDVEWTDGYGPEMDLYPAMAGKGEFDYSSKVHIWCEKGLSYLETLEMVIGPEGGGENIILQYDFTSDSFRKIGDPLRMVVLNDDFSSASPYSGNPDYEAVVEFRYDFNLNWQRTDHVSILFRLAGRSVKGSQTLFENQFKVVSHVLMAGNFSVEDSRGKQLIKGDWVRGGDTLHFYGLERRYADENIPISPPDMVKIGIKDIPGNIFVGEGTSDLDTYVPVDPIYGEMEYKLVFINVTPEADESSETDVKVLYTNGFILQIDSDNPGIPGQLQVLPDDKTEQPRNYDDDKEVFIKWDDAIDQSSGVAMYHFSVNRNKAQARPSDIHDIPKGIGENAALVENLPEGVNKIYLWAEDLVGNTGNEIFVEVTIDLTGVTFGGFYPHTGIWNTQLRPTCSIFINDTLTGVDPLSIEYEISTSGAVGLVGNWQNIPDTYASGNSLRVVVQGWFRNGKDNWIRFRAQDMAGNSFVISDAYNVWVDAESPKYRMLSHSEDEYQLNPYQEVKIMVEDLESGVDASSIEYRLTTRGETKWTPWKAYKDGVNGRSVEVRIRETFRRGDDNFIQVRARDLAGNPISYSKTFNIKINTYPEIVITSPSSGDILYDDTDIVFDASQSYDPDGDRLTFTWLYSVGDEQTTLGEVARYIGSLPRGEYTITLLVKDRVNNEVQQHFTITVEGRAVDEAGIDETDTTDTDGDGMPDWYEKRWKLNYLVKDANEDPDGDGFTNIQEFGDGKWFGQNLTNPKFAGSHPPELAEAKSKEDMGPFSSNMVPLWIILAILVLAVIITMMVVKAKKDKQVKKIKTVRNMRKIMPSVSWDQITATAYMAPYVQGPALAAAAGPALPSGAPQQVAPESALPPAQEGAVQEQQPGQAQETPAAGPGPAPAPAEPQPAPAPIEPQPAPAPAEPQSAPAQQPEYQPPQQ